MQVTDAVSEFLDYLRVERGVTEATIQAYRTDLSQFASFLEEHEEPTEVQKISTPVLRRYLMTAQVAHHYSSPSISRKISSLRSLFGYLVSQDYLERNPAAALRTPPKRKRVPVYLTEPELRRLLHVAEISEDPWAMRDLVVLKLLAYTGIRRSELIAANWNDVDLGEKVLKIQKGKGNKQRLIPLADDLVELLTAYLQTRLPLENPALVLGNWRTRISKRLIGSIVRKYVKKAGIKKPITAHKLRHTFATVLLEKNVDLVSIQQLLGHSDLSTTEIYVHTNAERLRDAVTQLQG